MQQETTVPPNGMPQKSSGNKGDLENAIYEAQKLPDVSPWLGKKKMLLEKIQIAVEEAQNQAKWQRRCQRLTDGLLTDCRDLIRDLLGQIPLPAAKLPKLLRKR